MRKVGFYMKKVFKLKELGCANCAAKMEREIAKLKGVDEVRVNFMTQKLTLSADDASFNDIVSRAQEIMKRVEPDCTIVIA